MTRVAWSRYSGDDVEAVVAMFISAVFPEAERITPSVGDGGIDVLVKSDRTRVYQVKKFTGPLTKKQEKQVQKSVDRLVADPRLSGLTVDEWHLVMPWDPTLEAKKWLTTYVTSKGLPEPIWDGLTKCDLWASQHPQVVDWYLGGNAERIQQVAIGIIHAARLKDIADDDIKDFDISRFAEDLKQTVDFLNREDPFYAYGIHVEPRSAVPDNGDLREALSRVKPGVVLATQWGDARVSVQVDVYAKNRVALELNPIQMKVEIHAESGSSAAGATMDFAKFGTPLELPSVNAKVSLSAPGGLGGEFEPTGMSVYPVAVIPEEAQKLRLILLDEQDRKIDELVLSRRYTTTGLSSNQSGPAGIESRLTDEYDIFELVFRFDVDTQVQTTNFRLSRPDGQLAANVLPVLRFYARMCPPYALAVAPRFGPVPSNRIPMPRGERDEDAGRLWLDVAKSLSLIQEHTSLPLHFPDLSEDRADLITAVTRTGALLDGQVLQQEAAWLATEHDPDVADVAETVVLLQPWEIALPEGTVNLGHLAYAFTGRLHKRAQEGPDGLHDIWSVNDGKLLMRTLTPDERNALPDTARS